MIYAVCAPRLDSITERHGNQEKILCLSVFESHNFYVGLTTLKHVSVFLLTVSDRTIAEAARSDHTDSWFIYWFGLTTVWQMSS